MSAQPPGNSSPADHATIRASIQSMALGALLAGGVCLYFGFTWLVDAPGSASKEATQIWYNVDHGFQWALRTVGIAFLAVAALAAAGQRAGALLGTIVESAFALLMLAMTIDTFLEARADGQLDATVILLLVLMAVGISAARHSFILYSRSAPDHGAGGWTDQ